MSERIEFTRNYSDLSTNQGFQYEFKCDRCGTGYRTRFQGSALGTAATALETASNIFGGFFNSLSNAGENVRSASWEKAHDDAFLKAVEEIKPDLRKPAGMRNGAYVRNAPPTWGWRWRLPRPAALPKRFGHIPRWLKKTLPC
jgi:hypothetical protein